MELNNLSHNDFLTSQRNIVGEKNVITDEKKAAGYSKGFRFGSGKVLAVIIPNSLIELWRVAKSCVEADIIMIMQAANTGLTGGSTPHGEYDRHVVIISTTKLQSIQLLDEGKQVVSFPGSRLYELEKALEVYDREPHSVIGSSCIGASIVGGVCNNSGGALIQRGPAYTEMALYARIDENQQLTLINHLGIHLGEDPEEILNTLEKQIYINKDIEYPERAASDNEYQERVRDVDADTPSRFNNDSRRLYETSGCAGKLIVFAVRLDTFPKVKQDRVFYIGSNDTSTLTRLRRDILSDFKNLPVAGEYVHRSYFDVCDKYGKDSFIVIQKTGSENMPKLFALKNKVDRIFNKLPFLPKNLSDKMLQTIAHLFPDHIPKKIRQYRDQYEHHLMLHMSDDGINEAKNYLSEFFANNEGEYFECTDDEGKRAFLNRFVAGGAAKRYHTLNPQFGNLLSLDIALRRNETEWFETLPPEIDNLIIEKLYTGHFMCHVMHQDYFLKPGVDENAVKEQLLAFLDQKGAEYPAEHNVGQLYKAKEPLKKFYKENDPTNTLNPGIGKTQRGKYWKD
ncbi:D-lactate dehydrogenase [Marinomonas rhizomae]|uniref:Quinone-dependent D-lactate dehydrogenase n=1 Tax=Marinomonas rhizomae TaxID=491948 RepID=A0A366IZ40_9GAMM|nr:D-lactate dehydrogenase [Marinomonas rhizomae]RBP80076.1 D-lactate dehydrogenase [Marinomonas rhizomae]RNF71999.1 D-lactate dehydrogenase [Marinomonas rhizomae]